MMDQSSSVHTQFFTFRWPQKSTTNKQFPVFHFPPLLLLLLLFRPVGESFFHVKNNRRETFFHRKNKHKITKSPPIVDSSWSLGGNDHSRTVPSPDALASKLPCRLDATSQTRTFSLPAPPALRVKTGDTGPPPPPSPPPSSAARLLPPPPSPPSPPPGNLWRSSSSSSLAPSRRRRRRRRRRRSLPPPPSSQLSSLYPPSSLEPSLPLRDDAVGFVGHRLMSPSPPPDASRAPSSPTNATHLTPAVWPPE